MVMYTMLIPYRICAPQTAECIIVHLSDDSVFLCAVPGYQAPDNSSETTETNSNETHVNVDPNNKEQDSTSVKVSSLYIWAT